jgi:monovalent cation/proton antiporter MnhG/PhaG subunit
MDSQANVAESPRLRDGLIRMPAATKAGTLAAGLMMAAVAVRIGDAVVTVRAAATVLFIFLTAPIPGHMIGRAALRPGKPLSSTGLRRMEPPKRPKQVARTFQAPGRSGDVCAGFLSRL